MREITTDEILFFNDWPQLMDLYLKLRSGLLNGFPEMEIRVSKTQISFYHRRMFAMVSLPLWRKKEWPKVYLMVSFGLGAPVDHPRIALKTEAYPGRWTHHVPVERPDQLDAELMAWLAEAHDFALVRR